MANERLVSPAFVRKNLFAVISIRAEGVHVMEKESFHRIQNGNIPLQTVVAKGF